MEPSLRADRRNRDRERHAGAGRKLDGKSHSSSNVLDEQLRQRVMSNMDDLKRQVFGGHSESRPEKGKQMVPRPPQHPSLPSRSDSTPLSQRGSSGDLMSKMMQRLSLVEKELKSRTSELKSYRQKCFTLEREVTLLKKGASSEEDADGVVSELMEENTALQSEVASLKAELSKLRQPFGLHRIDVAKIKKNVEEINAFCGEGVAKVVRDDKTGTAMLRVPDPVKLIFFENGLQVQDQPFRPYQWAITKAMVEDLQDGYIPYEFKAWYPEGVPMEVIDATDKSFNEKQEAVSKEAFLSKLPETVLRNGRLISVRKDIDEILSGQPGNGECASNPLPREKTRSVPSPTSAKSPQDMKKVDRKLGTAAGELYMCGQWDGSSCFTVPTAELALVREILKHDDSDRAVNWKPSDWRTALSLLRSQSTLPGKHQSLPKIAAVEVKIPKGLCSTMFPTGCTEHSQTDHQLLLYLKAEKPLSAVIKAISDFTGRSSEELVLVSQLPPKTRYHAPGASGSSDSLRELGLVPNGKIIVNKPADETVSS